MSEKIEDVVKDAEPKAEAETESVATGTLPTPVTDVTTAVTSPEAAVTEPAVEVKAEAVTEPVEEEKTEELTVAPADANSEVVEKPTEPVPEVKELSMQEKLQGFIKSLSEADLKLLAEEQVAFWSKYLPEKKVAEAEKPKEKPKPEALVGDEVLSEEEARKQLNEQVSKMSFGQLMREIEKLHPQIKK